MQSRCLPSLNNVVGSRSRYVVSRSRTVGQHKSSLAIFDRSALAPVRCHRLLPRATHCTTIPVVHDQVPLTRQQLLTGVSLYGAKLSFAELADSGATVRGALKSQADLADRWNPLPVCERTFEKAYSKFGIRKLQAEDDHALLEDRQAQHTELGISKQITHERVNASQLKSCQEILVACMGRGKEWVAELLDQVNQVILEEQITFALRIIETEVPTATTSSFIISQNLENKSLINKDRREGFIQQLLGHAQDVYHSGCSFVMLQEATRESTALLWFMCKLMMPGKGWKFIFPETQKNAGGKSLAMLYDANEYEMTQAKGKHGTDADILLNLEGAIHAAGLFCQRSDETWVVGDFNKDLALKDAATPLKGAGMVTLTSGPTNVKGTKVYDGAFCALKEPIDLPDDVKAKVYQRPEVFMYGMRRTNTELQGSDHQSYHVPQGLVQAIQEAQQNKRLQQLQTTIKYESRQKKGKWCAKGNSKPFQYAIKVSFWKPVRYPVYTR